MINKFQLFVVAIRDSIIKLHCLSCSHLFCHPIESLKGFLLASCVDNSLCAVMLLKICKEIISEAFIFRGVSATAKKDAVIARKDEIKEKVFP